MFEHLSELDPQGRTAWLDLPMIAPDAAVELRFAGESNRPYFNAMLARAAKRARTLQAKGLAGIDPAMIAENRREDRELFPAHVIVDWRGIRTRANEPVECTLEARKEFCAKLPAWIFDQIRNGAASPERFLQDGEEAPPDGETVAGNSSTASAGS